MIHFNPSFYFKKSHLNRIPNLNRLIKSSCKQFFNFYFHPKINLDESNIQINPTASLDFAKKSSVVQDSSLLHIDSISGLGSDIMAIKDSRTNHSTKILEDILKSQASSLEEFKNFKRSTTIINEEFTSKSPLEAIEFFLMDLLYSEKQLLFEEILLFIQHNQLSVPGNAAALEIFSQNGLNQPFEDTQIKKLYIQYCVKVKSNSQTINLVGEYSVLKSVIEIVLINFIYSKLNEERQKDFNEQYQEQKIVTELLYETLRDVFQLGYQKREDDVFALKFDKTRIVMINDEENQVFKARLE